MTAMFIVAGISVLGLALILWDARRDPVWDAERFIRMESRRIAREQRQSA